MKLDRDIRRRGWTEQRGQIGLKQVVIEEDFKDMSALRYRRARSVERTAVLEHEAHVRQPFACPQIVMALELLRDCAQICVT